MRFYVRKTLAGLVPADEEASDALRRYKIGEVYRCDMVWPRSYQHLKLVMALLSVTYKNLPERYHAIWRDPKAFRRGLADAVGHVGEYVTKDGEVKQYPRSLSYDDMPDEGDFAEVAARMMAVCSEILGMEQPDLAAQVELYMTGGSAW